MDFIGFKNININCLRFFQMFDIWVKKWLKVMLFHKMSDNYLFSLFLTSFLSHFETSQKKNIYILKKKQIQREKNILRFFTRKIKRIFLVRLLFLFSLFFLCHQTSPILGSILHTIFNLSTFLYYLGNM